MNDKESGAFLGRLLGDINIISFLLMKKIIFQINPYI